MKRVFILPLLCIIFIAGCNEKNPILGEWDVCTNDGRRVATRIFTEDKMTINSHGFVHDNKVNYKKGKERFWYVEKYSTTHTNIGPIGSETFEAIKPDTLFLHDPIGVFILKRKNGKSDNACEHIFLTN